jgi:Mg-chelatase subunit ChlD
MRKTTAILKIMAWLLFIQCSSPVLFANENVPQPLVDPLGALELYAKVEYWEVKSRVVQLSGDGGDGPVSIGGDQWVLEATGSGSKGADKQKMVDYLTGLNAEFLEDPNKKDGLNAMVIEAGVGEWWVSATFKDKSYRLTTTLVRSLSTGHDISLEFGGGKRRELIFYSLSDGSHYQTMAVEAPTGHVEINNVMDREPVGEYVRRVSYTRTLTQEAQAKYRLGDIPQEAGRYQWKVKLFGDVPVGQLRLELQGGGPLEVIERDAEVGSILVQNISNAIIYAEPEGNVRFEHPAVEAETVRGDILPNGDSLLMVPPGFWRVYTGSPKQIASRMIPVKPGKQTIIHWPNYLGRAFGRKTSDSVELTGIEIGENTGVVRLNLLGDEASDITPSLEEFKITEGGQPGEVLFVSPIDTPPDIVMLLDSSGSMKGQMTTALEATRNFIQSLPANARVRVVDFDTQAKLLAGEDKETVLGSLSTVKANGATALYDTAIEGMDMLSGSKRPALVLFTDGVDANWDDSGPGSKASKDDLFRVAANSSVPVFSIGFGAGHDQDTLNRLSSLSGGLYFSADDPDVLATIFKTVRNSVVKGYQLTYKRPATPQLSDVPVVQLVLDRSGSMSEAIPENKGISRRNTLQEIMRDFILGLSSDTLVSVQSFDTKSVIEQVATRDKDVLLRSIAMIKDGAGTDIQKATQNALESLRAIPSTQRYMVLVTDAAMTMSGKELKEFDTLLNKLKDENIRTFWMGIGVDPSNPQAQDSFKHAAELSGGRYVVSQDAVAIKHEFTELVESVNSSGPSATALTGLRLDFEHRKSNGKVARLSAARLVEVPTLTSDSERAAPDALRYEFTDAPPRYDVEMSSLLIGDEPPGVESVVEKRIPLNVKAGNEAFTLRAMEAVYLSRLKGAEAPDKQRFLALTLELTNILAEQDVVIYPDGTNHPASWTAGGAGVQGRVEQRIPAYLIPDLQRHLYLRYNDQRMLPVSVATWLSESPLMVPGEQSVLVKPGEMVVGSVVFLIPDEPIDQKSLHYYDAVYGHVDLALIGEFSAGLNIADLPASKPVRMSDAFSLSWLSSTDVEAIEDARAPEGTIFRIIDASLQSNLQALLAIDPFERFALRLPTGKGDIQFPLHAATALLPLGFFQPSMMTPGSANRIRLAFQVPAELAGREAGTLVVDIRDDRVVIVAPNPGLGHGVRTAPEPEISGDGIGITINQTGRLDKIDGQKGPWYLADVTIFDEKDGEATRIGHGLELFSADISQKVVANESMGTVREEKKGLGNFGQNDQRDKIYRVYADSQGAELLAGFSTRSVIPDGGHRRGILLFRLPGGVDENAQWQLQSGWIPGLDIQFAKAPFQDAGMLLPRKDMRDGFKKGNDQQLKDALAREVRAYRARASEKPGGHSPVQVGLDRGAEPVRQIPVPSLVLFGARDFNAISELDTLRDRLAKLRWLPGGASPWAYLQSPESVLTQAWGTQGEFARMAEVVLSRQGFHSERDLVAVTDTGRARLAERAGLAEVDAQWLPALRYREANGNKRLLVSPFMQDIESLQGLVLDGGKKPRIKKMAPARLHVIADVISNGGDRTKRAADMADALAGGQDNKQTRERYLVNTVLDREALSRGALDIIYAKGEDDKGSFFGAMLEYPGGQQAGKDKVYSREETIVKLRIRIKFDGQWLEHVRPVMEGESVTGVFHTLGLNLPDLPAGAAEALDEARQLERQAGHPDDLSALRWYTHGIIARLIAGQTTMEEQIGKKLDLKTGRTKSPRVVIVTMYRGGEDQPIQANIDLRRMGNDIHDGRKEAQHAFRIISGLQMAELEQVVLGEQGKGTFGLWARAPANTPLFWISPRNRRDITEYLKALSYPESIVSSLAGTRNFVLFPTRPTVVNGRHRWGWLEVNPKTYETISVLDNGQYGSMVEWDIQNWFSEAQLHMFGAMLGVSTSVWGMSIFSLQTDDYEEIRKKAEALVRSIGVNLADFNTLKGAKDNAVDAAVLIDQGGSSSGAAGGGGSGGVTVTPEVSFDTFGKPGGSIADRFEGKIKIGQDMIGFGQGFKAGVDFYFSR